METIEIIRELLPVVASAGEGAFILAMAVVLKPYAVTLIWATLLGTGTYFICRACIAGSEASTEIHHALEFRAKVVSKITGDWYAKGATRKEREAALKTLEDLLARRDVNPGRDRLLKDILYLLRLEHVDIETFSGRAQVTSALKALKDLDKLSQEHQA